MSASDGGVNKRAADQRLSEGPGGGEDGAPNSVSELTADSPEKVPAKVWVTLVTFAAFVVAFLTCASKFLFN